MALKNLTVQERLLVAGLVLLLAAGTLTRIWRHSRTPDPAPPVTRTR